MPSAGIFSVLGFSSLLKVLLSCRLTITSKQNPKAPNATNFDKCRVLGEILIRNKSNILGDSTNTCLYPARRGKL